MTVADRSSEEFWVCRLGTAPYLDALASQERIRARRQAGELPDTLLLLEHPPVYTSGRRSADGELPFGDRRARGPRPQPARSSSAPGVRPGSCPTRCCCWSTRPCTRAVDARPTASCRS